MTNEIRGIVMNEPGEPVILMFGLLFGGIGVWAIGFNWILDRRWLIAIPVSLIGLFLIAYSLLCPLIFGSYRWPWTGLE